MSKQNSTRFARSMNEAFPDTVAAAQWLEGPEAIGISLTWFIKIVVITTILLFLWKTLC